MTTVTEVTRRKILDYLSLRGIDWAGRLTDADFLSRITDLSSLPSTDTRYSNAYQDIYQHTVAWSDWERDWVFWDSRFQLLHGPDEFFLKFITETLHPVVRADKEQAKEMAAEYNRHLQVDGWALVEHGDISGHPIYEPVRAGQRHTAVELPTGWAKVDRQVQEARLRLSSGTAEEHFQTVGLLCRETLISLAQECFSSERHWRRDDPPPSRTDAARMLEAFFATELAGAAHEEARAHGKASLKLALALQHHRHANYQMAALCLEGTASVVNLVSILVGRR
jgi:hypothetical protein